MSSNFVDEQYFKIVSDPEYRQNLINDPKKELSQECGYSFDENTKIEIVEQSSDTIIIMLPTKPEAEVDIEPELQAVTERVVDLLFTDGIGGYLIPHEDLKWELRNMRKAWANKLEDE